MKLLDTLLVKFPPMWCLEVHKHIHKIPSLSPILSKLNTVCALEPSFFKIQFNILPSVLRFHKLFLPFEIL